MHLDSKSLNLSNGWEFRVQNETGWQPIPVPGCWEMLGIPRDWEGPGWYRRVVSLPKEWHAGYEAQRLQLRFEAVSYACTVYLCVQNDSCMAEAGRHRGAWDSFTVPFVVSNADPDDTIEILIKVLKPGGRTYPVRGTTAGFLPYVSGYLFGGIWQEVWLEEVRDASHSAEAAIQQRVTVLGSTPLLDGKPFYPRFALSWGWYPNTLHCNPPLETMRDELTKLRELGFNGVKCCLWIPPPAFLRLCDEMELLVWLELPLWLPEMDSAEQRQVFKEYTAIVRQTRQRRCIVIWSLGCELSASCSESFLRRLYERVKSLTFSPLVRDNSGGGECYNGNLQEHADYYDYHLYCDLPFLRNTFDLFLPRWRTEQPWFFGEFCDADACRDLPALTAENGGVLPWWTRDDPKCNPQGARWDMNVLRQVQNLTRHRLNARLPELREGQRKQTLLHRKVTIELVRSYREMSGYVITGLRDTPISISGMIDDSNNLRYQPDEFISFNADTLLFLGWERRRQWYAGGDRPAYIDTWTHRAGETILPRLGISHYGPNTQITGATMTLLGPGDQRSEQEIRTARCGLASATVREIGIAPFQMPRVETMTRIRLDAEVTLASGETVRNEWPLWVIPATELPAFKLYDPDNEFNMCAEENPRIPAFGFNDMSLTDVILTSRADDDILEFVRHGGRAVICCSYSPHSSLIAACPFWREAMKQFEPHPLWDHFPHEGFTDLNFYGLGADCALVPDRTQEMLRDAKIHPILRRIDARTFDVTDYLIEAAFPGGGKLILTTLRPQGGLGDQPSSLKRHTTGQYFLSCLHRYLTQQ